jgi:hypothetical protein
MKSVKPGLLMPGLTIMDGRSGLMPVRGAG